MDKNHEKMNFKEIILDDIKIGYYPSLYGVDIRFGGRDTTKIKKAQR